MLRQSCLAGNNCDPAIFNSSLSILNYLKLQKASASNEYMTAGHHTRLVAGKKGDRSRNIFRIEVLFQRAGIFDALTARFRHNPRRFGEGESRRDVVDRNG